MSGRRLVVVLGAGDPDAAHAANGLLVGALLTVVGANLVAFGLADATIPKLVARVGGGARGEASLGRLAQELVLVQLPTSTLEGVSGAGFPRVWCDHGREFLFALFADHPCWLDVFLES